MGYYEVPIYPKFWPTYPNRSAKKRSILNFWKIVKNSDIFKQNN